MYEKTYREVSLLATEYFRALMTIKAHEYTKGARSCKKTLRGIRRETPTASLSRPGKPTT